MPAISELMPLLLDELTTFPGNLTYHLVLAFAIGGSLYAAYTHWRSSGFPQGRRTAIGLSALLLIRLIYFLSAGLMDPSQQATQALLPVLDRTATALSLTLIVWLWAFPEPSRASDAATLLIALLILSAGGFTTASWTSYLTANPVLGGYFNSAANYVFNTGWEALALGISALGLFLLLVRRPNGWSAGLISLLFLFAGHLIQIITPQPNSDYPGFVRLAQLAAYPLLLTLPQRFPLAETFGSPVDKAPTIERRSYSTTLDAFQAFVDLTTEKTPSNICQALTKTVSHIMLADLCLLITPPNEEGDLTLECGYDLIRQQSFGSTQLNAAILPVITAALRKGRPLRLPASSTSPDLKNLGQVLGLEHTGHLIVAPIRLENQMVSAGVVLLSPYSSRGWRQADQEYLIELTGSLARIAGRNYQTGVKQQELSDARQRLRLAEAQLERKHLENEDLRRELHALNQRGGQDPATAESLAELIAAQEEAQDTIASLQHEVDRLRAVATTGPLDSEHLAGELQQALEEVGSPAPMDHAVPGAGDHPLEWLPESQAEVIASIAQELRQPMSSVTGYTDLLLSESVGILGTLQIKFLERIKASVERMRSLLEDLIQVTAFETGQVEIRTERVNLGEIIDEAIAFTRGQLSENKIILRVDLPEKLPELNADRDALQQILIHLLQNAGSVTPNEGEIALHARVKGEEEDQHILIQVTDSGGGIPEQDLPRVFSRLYRADKALIQGVGDTGVGLALAKALVDAHEGQIWVDSEPGQGSRFSVMLPLNHSPASEQLSEGPET